VFERLSVLDLARGYNMSPSTARRYLRSGEIPGEKVYGKWLTTREEAERWLASNGNWARARLLNKEAPTVVVPSRLQPFLFLSSIGSRSYSRRGKAVPHERFRELEDLGFSFVRVRPGSADERYVLLDRVEFVSWSSLPPIGPGPMAVNLGALEAAGSA
jgi:hypothetical protein